MRFCSRCGFPLTIVSQLVANGGALAGFDTEGKPQISPRRRGIRTGAVLMIVSALLIPTVALMTELKSDLAVLFGPVLTVFLYGLTRLLYAFFAQEGTSLQKSTPSTAATGTSQQSSFARHPGLPAHESVPISNWRRPINTSEMAQPASITEQTTGLLGDETGEKR